MINIIFKLIKPFYEISCPVDVDKVVLEKVIPFRVKIFHHRIKACQQNASKSFRETQPLPFVTHLYFGEPYQGFFQSTANMSEKSISITNNKKTTTTMDEATQRCKSPEGLWYLWPAKCIM